MPISIDAEGRISTTAYVRSDSGRETTVDVTTYSEITPEGIAMHCVMPHPIPWRGTLETTVPISAEDLVTLIKWQLENADEEARERMRQALLDIPREAAINWILYFCEKLAKPEPEPEK